MSRSRRWVVRSLILLIASFTLFAVLPTAIWFRRSQRILRELQAADSVWVEEFVDDKILLRKELGANQRAALPRVLPSIVPRGFPVSLKLCFVPHHRFLLQSPGKTTFVVTVCFGCDQAQHTDAYLYDMPEPASVALRKFLTANEVPVRSLEEYALLPESESPDSAKAQAP